MPRKLTNESNLPSPLFYAIKNDTYEARGDISVTTLIDSPYIRLLKKYNNYEEDAADSIYSLLGQGVHHVVERVGKAHEKGKFFPEFKMELDVEVEIFGKPTVIKVTGTTDLVEKTDEGKTIVHDFKTTSVFKCMKSNSGDRAWTMQLNFYSAMLYEMAKLKEKEFIVDELYIHAIIRDWSKMKARFSSDYPKMPVQTFRIPKYRHESVMDSLKKRIQIHFETESLFKRGEDINSCNTEERWSRPETWRIVPVGGKRSVRNFEINSKQDEQDAIIYLSQKNNEGKPYILDKQPGEDIRCQEYCSVCQFCKYYKATYGNKEKGTNGAGEVPAMENNSGQLFNKEIELDI